MRGSSAFAFVTAKTKGSNNVLIKALRNTKKMFGHILSINLKETKSNDAPSGAASVIQPGKGQYKAGNKYTVKIRVGALVNDPEAIKENDIYVRKFEIIDSDSMKKAPKEKIPVEKHVVVAPYSDFSFQIDEKHIKGYGPFEEMDVVALQSITYSYFFSEKHQEVIRYCNVDSMRLVPGGHRGCYAYDIWMGAKSPMIRADIDSRIDEEEEEEEGDGEETKAKTFKKYLGTHFLAFPMFGTDMAAETAHLARTSGDIYYPDFVEAVNQDKPQEQIVAYVPNIYDGDKSVPHIGFKTHAKGLQWSGGPAAQLMEAGNVFVPQVFFAITEKQVALFGISTQSAWKAIAPHLMSSCKFLLMGRENLERTKNDMYNQEGNDEQHAEEGVDIKLAASVHGMAINLAHEIERIGNKLPKDVVTRFAEAAPQTRDGDMMLESPFHEHCYHSLRERNTVISLSEWKGNLTQLIKDDLYDFYLVTDLVFRDEKTRLRFEALPQDKRYLIFDEEFRDAIDGKDEPEERKPVNLQYGLDAKANLTVLIGASNNVQIKKVYAVLKPQGRLSGLVQHENFVEAVRAIVPNPDEFLAQLEHVAPGETTAQGQKRARPEAAAQGDTHEPPNKKNKKEKEPDSLLSVDEGLQDDLNGTGPEKKEKKGRKKKATQ